MHANYYDDLVPDMNYFIHRKCTADWRIDEDTIGFIDLTYVVRGSAEYRVGNRVCKVSGGDLLCIPQGSLRSATSCPEDLMECYAANFELRNLRGEDASLPFPLLSHIGAQTGVIALYKDLNVEWLTRESGHRMKVRAFFMLILQRYLELLVYQNDPGMVDVRVRKAIRYITDHYAEPLTIAMLAEAAGLNHVYFGALFKCSTGMSFRQYLNSIRLNQAENMLHSGEYNVNEAAQHCGFSDIFYFSKVFKESRGISPSKVYTTKEAAE